MPAAITADWEAVKTTAIALNSIKIAAEQHGVTYEAAKMRASREEWPVGQRLAKNVAQVKQQLAIGIQKANPGTVTTVTSSSDALANVLKQDGEETRISLSKGVRKAAKHVENMPKEQIFAGADRVKHLVGAASTLHGWEEKKQDNSFSLSILSIGGDMAIQVNEKQ